MALSRPATSEQTIVVLNMVRPTGWMTSRTNLVNVKKLSVLSFSLVSNMSIFYDWTMTDYSKSKIAIK